MEELKVCPFCGGEAAVRDIKEPSVNGWVGCQRCRCFIDWVKNGKSLAIAAWNRRTQPENEPRECPAMERVEGGIPYCSDKQAACNGCQNAQPENERLTLDEMNALDHEPIYVLHTGGKWRMNGWHIATASSYQNHGRCDLEIDNGNTIIDMQNYGNTWLAYRYKPERRLIDGNKTNC